MYWIQINENGTLVRRGLNGRTDITVLEDCGFFILTGKEDAVIGYAAAERLTISDEGEGEPDIAG